MTLIDMIYAAAPWVALGIAGANWRPIVWLARVVLSPVSGAGGQGDDGGGDGVQEGGNAQG